MSPQENRKAVIGAIGGWKKIGYLNVGGPLSYPRNNRFLMNGLLGQRLGLFFYVPVAEVLQSHLGTFTVETFNRVECAIGNPSPIGSRKNGENLNSTPTKNFLKKNGGGGLHQSLGFYVIVENQKNPHYPLYYGGILNLADASVRGSLLYLLHTKSMSSSNS